jgi:NADPH:quinone reductase
MSTDVKTKVQGIRIEAYGGPEVMKFSSYELPMPARGEARVKLSTAGVNFIDIYHRRGRYPVNFPYTLGLEGAGVVESIGEGVTEVKPGDRVAYSSAAGSYAEANNVPAKMLIPLPSDLNFEQGAALPLQGMTAHYLLHEFYKLKPGETVLIHAAAGGMGLLLVQWAKHLGARVIGTVSTEEKAKVAGGAGADDVILYTEKDFVAESKRLTNDVGPVFIIDGVGKDTFAKNLEAVAPKGHVVIFGASSGVADPIVPNSLQPRSITISGGSLFNYLGSREELLMRANAVIKGIEAGWLKLKIAHVLPLNQASKAHGMLEDRATTGKILLNCQI